MKKRIISRIEQEKEKELLRDLTVQIHNALIELGYKFYWD